MPSHLMSSLQGPVGRADLQGPHPRAGCGTCRGRPPAVDADRRRPGRPARSPSRATVIESRCHAELNHTSSAASRLRQLVQARWRSRRPPTPFGEVGWVNWFSWKYTTVGTPARTSRHSPRYPARSTMSLATTTSGCPWIDHMVAGGVGQWNRRSHHAVTPMRSRLGQQVESMMAVNLPATRPTPHVIR